MAVFFIFYVILSEIKTGASACCFRRSYPGYHSPVWIEGEVWLSYYPPVVAVFPASALTVGVLLHPSVVLDVVLPPACPRCYLPAWDGASLSGADGYQPVAAAFYRTKRDPGSSNRGNRLVHKPLRIDPACHSNTSARHFRRASSHYRYNNTCRWQGHNIHLPMGSNNSIPDGPCNNLPKGRWAAAPGTLLCDWHILPVKRALICRTNIFSSQFSSLLYSSYYNTMKMP